MTSNVATVSITVTAAPPRAFHVGDLDHSTAISGRNWTAMVTILIHTARRPAVERRRRDRDVEQQRRWHRVVYDLLDRDVHHPEDEALAVDDRDVTFRVTAATKSGWAYASALSHDPDDDSNGTQIVIVRPT